LQLEIRITIMIKAINYDYNRCECELVVNNLNEDKKFIETKS